MIPSPKALMKGGVARNLVILFFVFGIVPLGILSMISFSFYFEREKQSVGNIQKVIAQRVSLGISDQLKEIISEAQVMAVALNPEQNPLRAIRRLADYLLNGRPAYSMISVSDPDGNEICKVSRYYTFRADELKNISQQESFKSALKGEIFLSWAYISDLSRLPHFQVTLPITNLRGRIVGVLEVNVNIAKIWDFISNYQIGQGRDAYVVDANGILIAYRDMSSILAKRQVANIESVRRFLAGDFGVYDYEGLDSKAVIGATAIIPLTGWGVIVEEPLAKALGGLYVLSTIAVGILALTALLAVLLGLRFSFKNIVEPIRRIQDGAVHIARGDFNRKVPVRKSDELGQLAQAFNAMAANLKSTTVSRDLLVQEIEIRKLAEDALQKQRDQAQQYLDIAGVLLVALDSKGRITLINRKGCDLLGYEEKELMGVNWFDACLPDHLRSQVASVFAGLMDGDVKLFEQYENPVVTKYGVERTLSFHNTIIRGTDSRIVGVLFSGEDITERKQLEKTLSDSAELLRAIVESTGDGILAVDENGAVVGANANFRKMWRIPEELMAQKDDAKLLSYVLDQLEQPSVFLEKVQTLYASSQEDFDTLAFKDGRIFDRSSRPLIRDGKASGRVWCFRDVTIQRRAEEALKEALREKEVLLREIHHRVKNNMQVISSLLTLQAERVESEKARYVLLESQQRIMAMAMIHEVLYGGQNLATIDLSAYLGRLVEHLREVYSGDGGVSINLDLGTVELSVDQAVPCGLIINELVTNSFKHAFPDGRPGTIQIKVRLVNGKEMVLEVSDNGVGLPPGLALEDPSTLGLRLVHGLLKHQLDGDLELSLRGGTTFILRWPLLAGKGESS